MRNHLMLMGVAGIAALSLFSCSKDLKTDDQLLLQSGTAITKAAAGSDELDAILKDLPPETYLLGFDGLPINNYITKSIYGTLSDETQFGGPRYPSPIPALYKLGYTTIPFKKIWIKTCPTMIPYTDIAGRVRELLKKVDSKSFADLAVTEIGDKQQLLATKTFLTAASRLQPDAIDKGLSGLSLGKFRLSLPANNKLPYFTRGFYGIGDITAIPNAGARTTAYIGLRWEDILRKRFPNLIGCFDPEILKDIRSKFIVIDKGVFTGLNVEEVAGGAIVGF
ncbi:hypothetical protein SAMN05518672_1011054 [Chitinophaga sp. CF118]|uniref:hypothetical protein n=1 Tax=Chitinophaga sp. CF118 TaxID=1884367 RepID=UPI0008E06AED|nr:hypothetical protein [Chitinophaga sp. CF118]SFD20892.1 hypothetical protein SAMN05518672_1011054 [Chitinophaga sp. CF118]